MKNILYIGPYKQADGWGSAGREYLRALRLDNNVKAVYVNTNGSIPHVDVSEFKDLEANNIKNFDAVIQNVLPPAFCYDRRAGKNIGLVHYESRIDGLDINKFKVYSNIMDQVWTPFRSGLNKERWMPIPTDIEKYKKEYQIPDFIPRDSFNIYFVGENIERKNIDRLVLAFHKTFNYKENVNLIIKTNQTGVPAKELHEFITRRLDSLKEIWGIHSSPDKYKKEIIVCGRLTEEELGGLHQGCHMFVMPSFGESHCMPMLDAIGYGNMFAAVENTGPHITYGALDGGVLIESDEEPVECFDKPGKTLYTSNECWHRPRLKSIMCAMRFGYSRYLSGLAKTNNDLTQFSYRGVGDKINEYLGQ